jgi:hypothetical protein
LCYSSDDPAGYFEIKRAGREVVQKEQGLCPLHYEIIYAHCDEVDSHSVVDSRINGDPKFGSDAICRADQDRVGESCLPQVKQSPKSSDSPHYPWSPGAGGQGPDAGDQRITGIYVDASVAIGETVLMIRRG